MENASVKIISGTLHQGSPKFAGQGQGLQCCKYYM